MNFDTFHAASTTNPFLDHKLNSKVKVGIKLHLFVQKDKVKSIEIIWKLILNPYWFENVCLLDSNCPNLFPFYTEANIACIDCESAIKFNGCTATPPKEFDSDPHIRDTTHFPEPNIVCEDLCQYPCRDTWLTAVTEKEPPELCNNCTFVNTTSSCNPCAAHYFSKLQLHFPEEAKDE